MINSNTHDKSSILKSVSKPGRYCGGEYGQIVKNKKDIKARFAFCFPDTYEIGMSNLGVRLLYGALNEHPDIWCERVYDPWVDMQDKMREHGLPLTALESGDPLSAFDFVGFTLQYEMSYTNVLNMLDLAKIPLRTKDRGEHDPLIIGGGPCAYNPEPVADFFDLFNIGEGEDMLPAIVRLYIQMKDEGRYTREGFLHEAAKRSPVSTSRRSTALPTTPTARSKPTHRSTMTFQDRSPSRSSRIWTRYTSPTRLSCPTSKRCTIASCLRSIAAVSAAAASVRRV